MPGITGMSYFSNQHEDIDSTLRPDLFNLYLPADSHVHTLEYGFTKVLPLEGTRTVRGKRGSRNTAAQCFTIYSLQKLWVVSEHTLNPSPTFSVTNR